MPAMYVKSALPTKDSFMFLSYIYLISIIIIITIIIIIIIINRFYLTHPFYVVLCSNIFHINNINKTQYMEVKKYN